MYNKKESLNIVLFALTNNTIIEKGNYVVPTLVSRAGESKTAVLKKLSNVLNANMHEINATNLGEKEITGLPAEVNGKYEQILYFVFRNIKEIEDIYINILFGEKTTSEKIGFLNGKLIGKDNTLLYENNVIYTSKLDPVTHTQATIRKDVFDNIPPLLKLQLLHVSKEIAYEIIVFDEPNRAIDPVIPEVMNIFQYNVVPGYSLPWFLQFVAAINPDSTMIRETNHSDQGANYNVKEFDDAVFDRFLFIPYTLTEEEWLEYLSDENSGMQIKDQGILTLSLLEVESKYLRKLDMTPLDDLVHNLITKRSITIGVHGYENTRETIIENPIVMNALGFNNEELDKTATNFLSCKCGSKFAVDYKQTTKNSHSMIDINTEVLISKPLSDETIAKFKSEKSTKCFKTKILEMAISKLFEGDCLKHIEYFDDEKHYDELFEKGVFNKNKIKQPYLQWFENIAKLLEVAPPVVKTAIFSGKNLNNILNHIAVAGIIINDNDAYKYKSQLSRLK